MKAVGVDRYILYFKYIVDSSGTKPFDIYTCILYI